MAGDWIKIEHSLPGKPEVMELARLLKIDEMAVVGHLICFWSWVDQNMSPECPATNGTKRGLDRVAGRDGFVDAMVSVGWLEFDGKLVRVPNYEHHLSQSAKMRALESRKKQRQRKLSPKCPDTNGTTAGQKRGLEKRREESITTEGEREFEHIIPGKLDDPECREAARKWFAYLESKGLEDKSPAGNEIALEEWWRQMAKFTRVDFLEAVSESIASGRWNVTRSRSRDGNGKPAAPWPDDLIRIQYVCRQHPQDPAHRKTILGARLHEISRKLDIATILAADDEWKMKTLNQRFQQIMKEFEAMK